MFIYMDRKHFKKTKYSYSNVTVLYFHMLNKLQDPVYN